MDESLKALLGPAKSILIVLPVRFNFDQVAGALSLYISSVMSEKEASIYCPTPMTVGVNRLVGVQRIKTEIGNKNLALTFRNYDAGNIEKVSYDIVDGEFKLTVVPKVGFPAPKGENIESTYSGISADLVILVGGVNDEDFPILSLPELSNVKIAYIGNRQFNSSKQVLSFATIGSSVSEVVTNLIKNNNLPIDPDIATNLVMGIEAGSSNFTTNETSPDTFEIFAYLLRQGGVRRPKVAETFPVGAIPSASAPARSSDAKAMEDEAIDKDGTMETVDASNPPADWLAEPKVYKGSSQVPQTPPMPSENLG